MPAYVAAVYEHDGVPGFDTEQPPSGWTVGEPDGSAGCVPDGTGFRGDHGPTVPVHPAGAAGAGPPVYHGSAASWPYQFTMSSDHEKPFTGQPAYVPLTVNGTRCSWPLPRSSTRGSSLLNCGTN